MNLENRWVKKATTIPWEAFGEMYAGLFSSKMGMPAKLLQMALGSLIIQKEYGYSSVELPPKQLMGYAVLKQVYGQQQYMYENQVHTVPNRIASINQPYIYPVVRGKASVPVEFGAKLNLSIDENGMARLEKLFFDAYNESDVLNAVSDKKTEYVDNSNRVEVERSFSLARGVTDLEGS